MTIFECTIAGNDEWTLQVLENLSFLLDKRFHLVLNYLGFLNAFESVFVSSLILDMEYLAELTLSKLFDNLEVTQFHHRQLMPFQSVKLYHVLFG
jgi:hypothetical protein